MELSKLEKLAIYGTGILVSDFVFGEMFTRKPLHESLGIESNYFTTGEAVIAAIGWAYMLIKSTNRTPRKEGREQYIREKERT